MPFARQGDGLWRLRRRCRLQARAANRRKDKGASVHVGTRMFTVTAGCERPSRCPTFCSRLAKPLRCFVALSWALRVAAYRVSLIVSTIERNRAAARLRRAPVSDELENCRVPSACETTTQALPCTSATVSLAEDCAKSAVTSAILPLFNLVRRCSMWLLLPRRGPAHPPHCRTTSTAAGGPLRAALIARNSRHGRLRCKAATKTL